MDMNFLYSYISYVKACMSITVNCRLCKMTDIMNIFIYEKDDLQLYFTTTI